MFLLVPLLSAGLTLVLTPAAIHLGRRWGLVDVPGGRRKHKGAVVRIGGLALYPAFLVAVLATLGIRRDDPLELTRLGGVLLGMGLVWVVGLLDDRFQLPSWAQGAGLVLASLAAVGCKVFIELFNNPFLNGQVKVGWYLMLPLTVIWLAGMSGTLNMLDGLDGLAAGVTAIASAILLIHMLRLGQNTVALLPLSLLGCCLGFLPFNFSPARIFLGGGAYLLGFGLGALSIVAGAKVATALLVVWLPIVDVLWQIYTRWRSGRSATAADRGHLHFRLLDMGWPQGRIVLTYYGITATLGGVALLISSRLLKFAVLIGLGAVILTALALVTRASGHRQSPRA
jgi:UDP-GlcNAc:undecaprenyl-phosphate GlcNAc-1-phosphate transferase